jgi:hypothetical protein
MAGIKQDRCSALSTLRMFRKSRLKPLFVAADIAIVTVAANSRSNRRLDGGRMKRRLCSEDEGSVGLLLLVGVAVNHDGEAISHD